MTTLPDGAPPVNPPAGSTGPAGPLGAARDEERLARVGLSRLVEPSDTAVMAAVAALGPVDAWRAALGELEPPGAPPAIVAAVGRLRDMRPRRDAPHRDVARADAAAARLLCPGDLEWPAAVDALGVARPLCLWVRGEVDLELVARRAVAIVGARAASGYGEFVAVELAAGLADRGWAVVSGGAYGIDGAAHRGAMAAHGVTVAVLACGVDVVYPKGHARLFDQIVEQGAVVTEWPPGCAPYPHRFLTRNRLIAALSAGTVVVEAALRSGARRTANDAAELGRHVMAVPGRVDSATSAGCHQMLREGAVCVTSAAEVLDTVGQLGSDLAEPGRGPDDPRDALPPDLRRTLEAVPVLRGRPADAIARPAAQPVADVRRALAALEIAGFVERHDGGYRLSGAERERRRAGRPSPGRPGAASGSAAPRDTAEAPVLDLG